MDVRNAQLSCWVITDGKAGMENQCIGLAEALGLQPKIKRVMLRCPWKQLSPFLRHGLEYAFSNRGDSVAPPWPDILIASGRAGAAASILARRLSKQQGGRGTFTVQIQNPVIDPSKFDLVVVPRHDLLSGAHVMTTRGSLHRVTTEMLLRESEKFAPLFASLPKPHIAVLIGGSNSVYSLTPKEMAGIAEKLKRIAGRDGSLLITASRRTGAENVRILSEALKDTPSYIWDGQGGNPYYGMLGAASSIVVTCDSVNLISEACSTGKPVMIIELPGGSDKFRRFHQAMRDDGMTRPFKGHIENWNYTPLDDVRLVAARIKEMLEQRAS